MDIAELQHLAGIRNKFTGWTPYTAENISITGTEKARITDQGNVEVHNSSSSAHSRISLSLSQSKESKF